VCSFLRSRTSDDALILSWNPRVFAFYAGRHSALYPQKAAPAEFDLEIPVSGPVYLVYYNHELDREKLTPYLDQSHPPLVFKNVDFQVFALPKLPVTSSK